MKYEDLILTLNATDEVGNKLYVSDDGEVRLKINQTVKRIGNIKQKKDGSIAYVKYDKESQIFRKNNSWSLPYLLMKLLNFNENNEVIVITDKREYKIKIKKVMEKGEFL